MHRALWRRVLATFVAIWFPLYAVEPAALLACPMHGALPSAQPAHHAAAAHEAPAGSHDTAAHHCTCLGDCCASTVALSAPEIVAPSAPATFAVVRITIAPARSHAPRAAEHALPFATAPPSV